MNRVLRTKSKDIFIITILFFLLITTLTVHVTMAQPTEFWYKTYGGVSNDWACSVVQTTDGGYCLAGTTDLYPNSEDFYLIRTDSNGNLEWNKTYGGIGRQQAYCMVQSHEGGYIIAGITDYYDQYIADDFYVVKADAAGNMLWNRTYGGGSSDFAYSMTKTNDGGYVITGQLNYITALDNGASDVYLIKIDGNGNLLWNKTHGGPLPDTSPDTGWSVIQTSDGGYAIAGGEDRIGLFIKTDSEGNLEWNKKFTSRQASYGVARAVVQAADGGYVIAGTQSSLDIYLIKINSAGEILWNKTFGGDKPERFASMIQTNDGGYALIGSAPDYTTQDENASGGPYLIKTDANGNMLWNKTFVGNGTSPYSIIQTSDEGYAIAGMAWPNLNDFFLIKTEVYTIPEIPSTTVLALIMLLNISVIGTLRLKKHETSKKRKTK